MKILSTFTCQEESRVTYKGQPFTGTIYELAEDGKRIVSINPVYRGEIGGPEKTGSKRECILGTGPIETDAKSSFSGWALDFDEQGHLDSETEYDNGKCTGTFISYFESGATHSFYQRTPEGEVGESWHENGALASWRPGLSVTFLNVGELSSITLDRPDTEQLSRFPLVCSRKICLSGDGVTDRVVSLLSNINSVSELAISDTAIGSLGLSCFVGLTDLVTQNNKNLNETVLKNYLSKQTHCHWTNLDAYR